ncbi:MAG: 3-deoxy-manno-octulosonate cytidylyltransferase [Bacteriovorax sp.]|nr:3-deoxy-manno-octulosonate cytidylyltransferase [Bacteriovorax sp.]
MKKRSVAIIPARMGSSRFPGKPMAEILGMPMIGHVYLRTKLCETVDDVYVATCDKVIFDYVQSIGGKAVMTKDTHERCTERTYEALLKIEIENNCKYDAIVMIQGDEPMVVPSMIEASVAPILTNEKISLVNLYSEIKTKEEHEDPNCVKVVLSKGSNAIYFSREAIPSWKKGGKNFPMYKQVCVISFTRDYLIKYSELAPTMLEEVESVDMNRVLENDDPIFMVKIVNESQAVDTPNDLKKASAFMQNDPLLKAYIK